MKILHINCNYIGTALHQIMMNHFTDPGITHQVFCPTYDKSLLKYEINDNVIVKECFSKWNRVFFFLKQMKIIRAIENEYDMESFHMIHAYTLFTDGNAAMELSRKYGLPYVVAVRDTDINTFLKVKPYLKARAWKIIKNAKAVFFLSRPYRDQLMRLCVPKQDRQDILRKCCIVPNGIDDYWHEHRYAGDFAERKNRIAKKQLNVVFVGRIDERKNPLTTQNAIAILRKRGWQVKLQFAGGIENKRLFDAVLQYPNTKYWGKLGKDEMVRLYQDSDIFVMPSHTETFGLVYAEAMSQGLPVIYTKGQGFDGQFPEGTVGYAVNDNNPEDVADKIEMVLKNFEEIGKNAVEEIKEFKWGEICEEYERVYRTKF